ncbi:MAG TPA: Ada metal-binding domain-containing protein, partial [Vicinamibacterales bacterium]|nr:Ada metal-binding domain-containing protein [Vicinamibacterales bacterium]
MNTMTANASGPGHRLRQDSSGPPTRSAKEAGQDTPAQVLNDAARWDAVLAHDRAADGRFVYAVRSTGVYCRPGCPSRRPRRDRVSFFDTPAAARDAG